MRRWIAPRDGTATIAGSLKHSFKEEEQWSDGVEAWIVHSRLGIIAQAVTNDEEFKLGAENVEVRAGDRLDFVVSPGENPENDDFQWAPEIRMGSEKWKAGEDFRGPEPLQLGPWARYAQALLASHEFSFVD